MGDIIRIEQIRADKEARERMTKLEYEARIEYLESYASELGKMHSADMRLEELELDYGPGVPKLSGMPSGGKSSDGSDRILRRMEDKKKFTAEYIRHRNAALKEMNSIEEVIGEISPKLQKVLRYRYLNEMDIGEIAEKLNYSYRQVQRHHQQGVERIRPPKYKINKIKERLQKEHPEWALLIVKSA